MEQIKYKVLNESVISEAITGAPIIKRTLGISNDTHTIIIYPPIADSSYKVENTLINPDSKDQRGWI